MNEPEDYKRGWYDGYMAAKRESNNTYIPTNPNIIPNKLSYGCKVCGINFGSGAWGYVCHNTNCPTKVSCGGEPYV